MYLVVKSKVRYDSELSPFIESNIGVKQGDPCSTILFLFFINDIVNSIDSNIDGIFTTENLKLFILLFADDAVIFAETTESLQTLLNETQIYCRAWNLTLNINKTKIMIFENGRPTKKIFYYNGQQLSSVTEFKYLGLTLYKNGKWTRTQKKLTEQSQYPLHKLFTVFNQLDLTIKNKCQLFDNLVAPILNYGAEVLGYNECKDTECVHCKFMRKVLHVQKSTNLDGLYGELGRYPMKIRRQITMVKFWTKLLNLDDNNITKKIYNMLKNEANNNRTLKGINLASHMKTLLDRLGLSNLWANQDTLTINYNYIKQRIIDNYIQIWHSNIHESKRLESYSKFKENFELEEYLSIITNKSKD